LRLYKIVNPKKQLINKKKSDKYSIDDFHRLAEQVDFSPVEAWVD